MSAITSAGLLLYRRRPSGTELFLVHPGGPFWVRKDDGAWSVPKGIVDPGEDERDAARREFREETGFEVELNDDARDLGSFVLSSGKRLRIWAVEGDCDPAALVSNLFELEWPPKSGRTARFPEVDRGGWFDQSQARRKVTKGQIPVIENFFAGQ